MAMSDNISAAFSSVMRAVRLIQSQKGKANGYASLGSDGKVPSTQLPTAPTVPVKAAAVEMRAGTDDAKFLTSKAVYDAFEQVALTPAQMAAGPDFDTFFNATVVLSGNITIGAPVNAKPGKSGTIAIAQDATGGRQVAWNAAYRLPAGFAIQATANGLTMVPYQVGAGGVVRIFPPSKWA